MLKRITGLILALALLAGILVLPAAAAGTDPVATVQALGIMTGDENGNLNLSKNVTRAEFCKMLVAASTYKDTVGGSSGYSLFKDVKSDHWAVEYIKTAVENGWFVGYLDGTFRPNNTITLEEAATVALRLLGYTSEDLAGSYPTAQLSKFEALGLHSGFSTQRGQAMSREDCAWLFYNLMAAQTKSGQVYAQTLGYTLDATGHVDYSALISADTEGPFTVSGKISLPFSESGVTVYRNGQASTLASATDYDIYYYNANLRTVWIYSNRITGTYTAASPSTAAPTSVTVAGVTYSIESSTAAYKLSAQGTYGIGDTVTLLLGMNGGVADVCGADEASSVYYGVVTGSGTQSVTAADGSVSISKTATVFCTDGVERVFETSSTFSNGTAVQVDYGAKSTVTSLGTKTLTGKVNSTATKLGTLALADDVEILDTDRYGNAVRIYPSRLAGANLSSGDVLYHRLNSDGEIDRLILRDVTGDTATYALVTDATKITANMQSSSSYECLIDGKNVTISSPNKVFAADEGGARILYEDGQVASMNNLSSVTLTGLTTSTASASNQTYDLSERVQVYILKDGDYYAATVSAVSDTERYRLMGWYDNSGYPAGGEIRIIVAREK